MKFFRAILAIALFVPVFGVAQYKSGQIVRECTNATGRAILNPNYATVSTSGTIDGQPATIHYASPSTSGWTVGGDDTSSSVNPVPFKPLKPYGGEPCCDLRRGADHRFSDFVPDYNNNGVYFYYDATHSAYVFRMRMGAIIPGSKGYSLLVDTDLKYGNTGSNADPNYVAKTTGINGNPGFELEIVLETGFKLAIYNIDGKGNPTDNISSSPAVSHTSWKDYSQVSMAATTEGGDPDFFIDFYVPVSDLTGITITDALTGTVGQPFITAATQKIRIIPTTVMAPKPSTAGPISDIYGSDMDKIAWYPPVCSTCNVNTICTPAPVITSVNGPSGTISGTWTRESSGYTGSTSAVITLYRNGDTTNPLTTTPATITCTSGGSWSATASGLVSTDVITAKAQGTGGYESRFCFTSNAKKLTSCSTKPNPLTITAFTTSKGLDGKGYTAYNGVGNSGLDYITLWKVGSSGFTRMGTLALPVYTTPNSAGGQANVYSLNSSITDSIWHFNGGTGGNSNPALTAGQYVVYDSTAAGCLSGASFFCRADRTGVTDSVTVTSPTSISTSTTSITGGWVTANGLAPNVIRVYLDSSYIGDATVGASSWTYTFNRTLTAGKQVTFRSQKTENSGSSIYYCEGVTTKTIVSPTCSNSTPYIDVDSTTSNLIPGFKITGLGTAGGSLKIFNSTNQLKETVTVATDGTWSSTFTALGTDVAYYVTLSTTGCASLATSATKTVSTTNTPSTFCNGTITGSTYGQITGPSGTNNVLYSDETSISGTLSSSGGLATSGTFVKMYIDSAVVGYATVNTANNTWGPVDVSGMLYNGAILTIGVIQSGTFGEYVCSSIRVVCSCALNHMPAKPAVDATSTLTVSSGSSPVIKIKNPHAGNFYSVKDSTTGNSMSKGLYYTGGDMSVSGRMLADSFITITTTPITATTTAQVVASLVGGTETCTDTTYESLRITQVLPILLVDFRGVRNEKTNKLSWRTTDEINFSHFEVERSIDGANYERIQVLNSRGSNSAYETSEVIDGQTFYYRLKMVDNDGKFKYSATIVLKDNGSSIVLNSVKPNPFRDNINISLFLNKEQDVKIMLVDMAGRIVGTSVQHGIQGNNLFDLNSLGQVSPGLYSLKIIANGSSYQEKMVKSAY
jgi:hypothetical protein